MLKFKSALLAITTIILLASCSSTPPVNLERISEIRNELSQISPGNEYIYSGFGGINNIKILNTKIDASNYNILTIENNTHEGEIKETPDTIVIYDIPMNDIDVNRISSRKNTIFIHTKKDSESITMKFIKWSKKFDGTVKMEDRYYLQIKNPKKVEKVIQLLKEYAELCQ